MADYAIGDLQGCYEPFQRLLDEISFDPYQDRLWFVGDLVNRGPESLAVLRFIKSLPLEPRITLGNHDLHLLANFFGKGTLREGDDTLHDVLLAPDAHEIGHWLRKQPIFIHDPALNVVMSHAGIAPMWGLDEAKARALEVTQALSGDDYGYYLEHMYGNEPSCWSPDLTGIDRLRVISNYFTRMRFCDAHGGMNFKQKSKLNNVPAHLYPWFQCPHRVDIDADIVFGHWASLKGECPVPRIHAIDTGCYWGGRLTALRLQDMRCFSVRGQRDRFQ